MHLFYSNNKNKNNNNIIIIIIIIIIVIIIIIITNLTLIRSFSKMGHRVILKIYEHVYFFCALFVVILCHFLMCNRIIIKYALNFYSFDYYYYYYIMVIIIIIIIIIITLLLLLG